MNGGDNAIHLVTAKLPSGVPIQVEINSPGSSDEITSAGLRDPDLSVALDAVGQIGSLVVEKLKAVRPSKVTVELRLGFAVEAGKLTALWVGGKGETSLTATLEWCGDPAASASSDG